jgi:atypical dual specificity phosphatase
VSRWFRTYGFADVTEGLVIGAYPLDEEDVEMLAWLGIRRVFNLAEDEEYQDGARALVHAALAAREIEELRVPLVDFGELPFSELDRAVDGVLASLAAGDRTYVHCRAGWQRSAAVAAGVIALREGVDIDRGLELVRTMKSTADPLPHQREDLRAWYDARINHRRTKPG